MIQSTLQPHVNSFASSFADSFDAVPAAVTSDWTAAVTFFDGLENDAQKMMAGNAHPLKHSKVSHFLKGGFPKPK